MLRLLLRLQSWFFSKQFVHVVKMGFLCVEKSIYALRTNTRVVVIVVSSLLAMTMIVLALT